ncbi:hypothetical protein CK203_015473 [Vitis vinifera]|uniref:Uncharacterized protein n=1 Tax=Vitis vinifera TaxID=29760 RepID=A0A438JKK0_VITVI|nr:hypothetical protein CK203_015473 [Vitis vinifera]
MSSKKKSASSARVGDAHEKSTDKLSVKEFRDRFCIPNGVIVELLNGEGVVSTEKAEQDIVVFSKEQFNAGLRFPLSALFMEFLHFTKIPPVFIHPNIIRVLMGCNIINMLYNLDLTLLEVFFVYSLKKAKTDIFSLSAHLPSLQLVRKKWATLWTGWKRRLLPVLSKLFEIDAKERQCKTLLTARNLMAVVREPQEYVINILPGRCQRRQCLGSIILCIHHHPDSPTPNVDAVEAICAAPMEEVGAESQSQPSDDPDRLALVLVKGPPSKRPRSACNLRSGLLGRLQDRQQEIEVSCSSAHDAHPEGGEVEVVTETPAVPVMVPAEVAPEGTHPAVNVEARIRNKSQLLSPHQGGILLMMLLAPPLVLLATRSWKRS